MPAFTENKAAVSKSVAHHRSVPKLYEYSDNSPTGHMTTNC